MCNSGSICRATNGNNLAQDGFIVGSPFMTPKSQRLLEQGELEAGCLLLESLCEYWGTPAMALVVGCRKRPNPCESDLKTGKCGQNNNAVVRV